MNSQQRLSFTSVRSDFLESKNFRPFPVPLSVRACKFRGIARNYRNLVYVARRGYCGRISGEGKCHVAGLTADYEEEDTKIANLAKHSEDGMERTLSALLGHLQEILIFQ